MSITEKVTMNEGNEMVTIKVYRLSLQDQENAAKEMGIDFDIQRHESTSMHINFDCSMKELDTAMGLIISEMCKKQAKNAIQSFIPEGLQNVALVDATLTPSIALDVLKHWVTLAATAITNTESVKVKSEEV